MKENKLIKIFEESIKDNWELASLTNYQKETYTYRDVAERIRWIHTCFNKLGIKKGDKIGLIGRNLSNWGISYIATVTYGAVVVPILSDFNSADIHHIANHSEVKLIFSTDILFNKIDEYHVDSLVGVISLIDFSVLCDKKGNLSNAIKYANTEIIERPISKDDIKYTHLHEDEMAVLSYTSGSSGFSKGVMLPYRSLYSNIMFAIDNIRLKRGDKVVSFLPLAHVFGCTFEFLTEFCLGAEVVFLTRVPTPQIIIKAFREIKPQMVFTVPMIIEKIYKKKISPILSKLSVKLMLKIPVLEKKIYAKINRELTSSFGGKFSEIIIGGAALNPDVEEFLMKIGFKFTVGYGMTECGPLISYSSCDHHKAFSCGSIIDRMEVKIDSVNPNEIPGEVYVKGMNLMLGYYKNKKATNEIFTKDGWMNTGDIGILDKEGHLFLKGRSKNMILGPSGQNIYPEEIESRLNNLPYILETVVADDQNNKLVAFAYPDYEYIDSLGGMSEDKLAEVFEHNRQLVNKDLPAYMQLSRIQVYPVEFEKTPKRNIKRYLYTNILRDSSQKSL